jgi:hypothetical protein
MALHAPVVRGAASTSSASSGHPGRNRMAATAATTERNLRRPRRAGEVNRRFTLTCPRSDPACAWWPLRRMSAWRRTLSSQPVLPRHRYMLLESQQHADDATTRYTPCLLILQRRARYRRRSGLYPREGQRRGGSPAQRRWSQRNRRFAFERADGHPSPLSSSHMRRNAR